MVEREAMTVFKKGDIVLIPGIQMTKVKGRLKQKKKADKMFRKYQRTLGRLEPVVLHGSYEGKSYGRFIRKKNWA